MSTIDVKEKTKQMIDALKGVCGAYGLNGDGNEYKIITQIFLYKFLNDKFAYNIKQNNPAIAKAESFYDTLQALPDDDYQMLLLELGADTAKLKPEHFITHLFKKQNESNFGVLFDDTLRDIAILNHDVFAVKGANGDKVTLFDPLSEYVDQSDRDNFCRALINKLIHFNFEHIFEQKYDFFATIFEYLISDYNKDSGGKYAEYYTPHAVAKIMASILVPKDTDHDIRNVSCYDPSSGSGTLLMNLAHAIGEDKCTIYSQDISQKSSSLLRLNLILNNLVHSIHNVIKGNTIATPYHRESNSEGQALKKFDYIVSNPPFKTDFSDYRDSLNSFDNHDRFFAGIPNIPNKKKEGMAIYQLFLQHIIYSLKPLGKAAIVLPTGFITAQSGIDRKIRETLIAKKMLAGVVSMPSNIFATTGTNVSILFLDKSNDGQVILIDASNLGEKVKEGKNQKTVLSDAEEHKIIDTFNQKQVIDDLSVVVSYDEIIAKNYSLSAGQYFDVKIDYTDISPQEFDAKMKAYQGNLQAMFTQSHALETEIEKHLSSLIFTGGNHGE